MLALLLQQLAREKLNCGESELCVNCGMCRWCLGLQVALDEHVEEAVMANLLLARKWVRVCHAMLQANRRDRLSNCSSTEMNCIRVCCCQAMTAYSSYCLFKLLPVQDTAPM